MAVKAKMILAGATACALFAVGMTNTVKADEHLTDQQIEQATQGLKDDQYVLTTAGGGIISNRNGSADFPAEQVASEGKVMTVAEYKEFLKNVDTSEQSTTVEPGVAFFGAWVPTRVHTLYANQDYTSNAFYARGWRYGEERFVPSRGTGDYLFWQVLRDSGLAKDGYGVSVTVNIGDYTPVYSRRGTYFKTYNPVPGSQYKVSNPV